MSALPNLKELPKPNRIGVPFVMVPSATLRNTALSVNARLLYAILLDYNTAEKGCFPGRERLAADMGVSTDTVDRSVKELAAQGIIKTIRRGKTQTNTYILNLDSAPVRIHLVSDSAPVPTHPESDSAPVRNKQEEDKEKTTNVVQKKEPGLTQRFEDFFSNYPKKENKQKAYEIWRSLSSEDREQAIAGLAWWLRCKAFNADDKYIKQAYRWLEERNWNDPVQPRKKSLAGQAAI